MAHLGRHAIVIGASMGGLLAARALADHYDEVTVLERDTLPQAHEPRKGVPQDAMLTGCFPVDARYSTSCSLASARKWSPRVRFTATSSTKSCGSITASIC